jgi:hypothetical protein
MKSLTSFIGWLLLAVILAVPAFLFYNWWMNKKAIEMKEKAVVTNSVPIPFEPETEDFPSSAKEFTSTESLKISASQKKINSKADNQLSLKPAMNTETAGNVPSNENMQIAQSAPPGIDKEGVSSSTKAESVKVAIATSALQGNQSAEVENTKEREGSYFEPKSDRDPTMTPSEYAQIKREIAAEKERKRRLRLESLRKKSGSSVQSKLDLQGVVGNNVIINGEMYSVGSYVKGVKIIKIGSNYFIGYYKGKKFKKVMR